MTVGSIPLLRPLFNGALNRLAGTLAKHGSVQEKIESISLGSIIPKGRIRDVLGSGTRNGGDENGRVSGARNCLSTSSSQEHFKPQQDPFAITQTVEVTVTTARSSASFMHAALVGLVEDPGAVRSIWH